ncbi:hypothetical protein ARMA_1863 [Ardenticatena maritima]|uniref:Uncharacterized protein n=1 Tax=Ardenticatena maritima TaxID=872965 RepID=A0A0M8K982_9CHLR|nr:hypothetical protein [Ardenticatena maritima]KPL86946.1 hypothetical protein SE16_12805 [Ardenticatena maritima]GAP63441.1 hypothetical protein ARMA_1863 [Ardenticatena maritima]
MGSLETWSAVAASFLLLQCIVGMLILAALGFGLWKGMAWVVAHADLAFQKAHTYLQEGRRHLRRIEQRVSAPFVRANALLAGAEEALRVLRQREGGDHQ